MLDQRKSAENVKNRAVPTLTLIGHASVKIKTSAGMVVYIDPYWPGDYSEKADLVLVTHEHGDHNDVYVIHKKPSTIIIREKELHPQIGEYHTIEKCGIRIQAVPAYNRNHKKENCVGYVLEFDQLKVYHAGDTSLIEEMKDLSRENIDYALYPTDGVYNMNAQEATRVADMVGARVNISIHNNSITEEKLFQNFTPKGRLFVPYGTSIELKKE